MTSHSLLTIVSHRFVKYFILFLLLGICVLLLLPRTSYREIDIFIPLDYRQIPAGLAMTKPLVSGIEVRIKGPKAKINALPDLKLRYEINLSNATAGFNSIPIDKGQIQLPSGFSVVKVNPVQIAVRIEKEVEKKLPIKISLAGKPATGYTVAGTIARPLLVTLRGPETAILPMDEAPTKPINVKGLSGSFKKEISLDLTEGIQIVDSSNIISAEILIEEKINVQKINDIIVKGSGTPYVYRITPPTIDIEVKGPASIVDKLDKENNINVYVDLTGLTPGVYIRRASITLPVGTTLVGVKPEIFTVKIINNKNN